jgi:hypothetical protein
MGLVRDLFRQKMQSFLKSSFITLSVSELDSCLGNETFQCDVLTIKEVQSTQLTEPGDDVFLSEEENFDEPEQMYIKRNESSLKEQTYRMFQHLVGLQGDGKFITVGKEDF